MNKVSKLNPNRKHPYNLFFFSRRTEMTIKNSLHLYYIFVKSIYKLVNSKTSAYYITLKWKQTTDNLFQVCSKWMRNDKNNTEVCMKDYVNLFRLVDIFTAYFSATDSQSTSVFQRSSETFPAQISLPSPLSFARTACWVYPKKVLLRKLTVAQLQKPVVLLLCQSSANCSSFWIRWLHATSVNRIFQEQISN
jgi:hypothetical protein